MLNQRIADFETLVAGLHPQILDAGNEAWRLVVSKGEVARIRDFLSGRGQGLDYMNRNIPADLIANGFELKFAAILVHQKPIVIPLRDFKNGKVKTGLTANPELGDLNLVFLFMDKWKKVRAARSIIYQAKTHRKSASEAIAQDHQKYLYDKAQGFQYRDGMFAGEKRSLPIAGLRRDGLHYLFVSESPVASTPVPSDRPAYTPWAESLYKLLIGGTGIQLAAGTPKGLGWSKIGEDLVEIFRQDASLKAQNLADVASWFNDFKNPEHWVYEASGDSFGVNTMLVIVRDGRLDPDEEGKVLLKKLEIVRRKGQR
jgi:hypothetical protein